MVHEQTGGASQPIGPRRQLAHYRKRIESLKKKLDKYQERHIFTHTIIRGHKLDLIAIQEEIEVFQESLLVRDRKVFYYLLDGIQYAIPLLGEAEERRAKLDGMSPKCHDLIYRAAKHLRHALDKSADQ